MAVLVSLAAPAAARACRRKVVVLRGLEAAGDHWMLDEAAPAAAAGQAPVGRQAAAAAAWLVQHRQAEPRALAGDPTPQPAARAEARFRERAVLPCPIRTGAA